MEFSRRIASTVTPYAWAMSQSVSPSDTVWVTDGAGGVAGARLTGGGKGLLVGSSQAAHNSKSAPESAQLWPIRWFPVTRPRA